MIKHATLIVALLATVQSLEFQRRPLAKPLPGIPTQRSTHIGDAIVTYNPRKEVYVFSYENPPGRATKMFFEYGTKVTAIVKANAHREGSDFRYQYSVYNFKTSRQGLNTLVVTSKDRVSAITLPDNGWHAVLLTGSGPARIPFAKDKGISWSDSKIREGIPPPPVPQAAGAPSGVPPGQSLSGFSFKSLLLPGIVSCYARGWTFIPVTHGEAPQEVDSLLLEQTFLYEYGKTVGPVTEPASIDPAKMLNQLRLWTLEARKLGWVNGSPSEIVTSLSQAAMLAEKGNPPALEKIINQALKQTEHANGKEISSELYAILKFNLEAINAKLSTHAIH